MHIQSYLMVLRSIISLDRFTVAEVMGRTGLTRAQVDPQISRLRRQGIVEYDKDGVPPLHEKRPRHRPIRFYRLAVDPVKRSEAFALIRTLRSTLWDDQQTTLDLCVLEGRLALFKSLLLAFQNCGDLLSDKQYNSVEQELRLEREKLDELTVELEVDSESNHSKVKKLRGLLKEVTAQIPRREPKIGAEPVISKISEWRTVVPVTDSCRREFEKLLKVRPPKTFRLDKVDSDFLDAGAELWELYQVTTQASQGYSRRASWEYALSRVAATHVPDLPYLLLLFDRLHLCAPPQHKHIYQYNHADLLAVAGRTKKAYLQWRACMRDVRCSFVLREENNLRATFVALWDAETFDVNKWEELQVCAGKVNVSLAVAFKNESGLFSHCGNSPEPELWDPFVDRAEVAIDKQQLINMHGVALRDIYRTQPGVSFSRLATMLHSVGVSLGKAWRASMAVSEGKVLVVGVEAASSATHPLAAELRQVLETEHHVHVIKYL